MIINVYAKEKYSFELFLSQPIVMVAVSFPVHSLEIKLHMDWHHSSFSNKE